jgi:hypothetical protein
MKKLIVVIMMLVVAPVMALEISGQIDMNYFMWSPADSDDTPSIPGPPDTEEISQSYFGTVAGNTKLCFSQDMGDGLSAFVKLLLVEVSDGADTTGYYGTEEIWVQKKGAFDQEALSFKFGKMEVPGNLDYDVGITHTFSNGAALISRGVGEIDRAYGLSVAYAVEGVGTFTLTTFEGLPGVDNAVDEKDEDTGLFQSIALQWATGADAFGVAGLDLTVAYIMVPGFLDYDNGSLISLGGTYTLMDGALKLGLEIGMSKSMAHVQGFSLAAAADTDCVDVDGGMLIALNVDYKINEEFSVGLSYEMLTYQDVPDGVAAGTDLEAGTDSRMAIRGSYTVAENVALRLEYASVGNSSEDIVEADTDGDGDEDDPGYSLISLGMMAKF